MSEKQVCEVKMFSCGKIVKKTKEGEVFFLNVYIEVKGMF